MNMARSSENTGATATPAPPDVPRLKSRFWTEERVIPETESVVKEATRGRKLGHDDKPGHHDYLPYLRYSSRDSSTYTDAVMYQEGINIEDENLSAQPERPASAPSSSILEKQNQYFLFIC